jgi:hypothetical protein
MVWLAPALLASVLSGTPHTGTLLSSQERRVRSMDRRITELLAIGVNRSPTFARIVRAVNATDVIVYLERSRDLPNTLAGRLLLLPLANGHRYLRIQVRADLPAMDMIALIGHELRHALEVAEQPAVRDATAMLALYQRIGYPTAGAMHTFDTEAAQVAGRRVRLELEG